MLMYIYMYNICISIIYLIICQVCISTLNFVTCCAHPIFPKNQPSTLSRHQTHLAGNSNSDRGCEPQATRHVDLLPSSCNKLASSPSTSLAHTHRVSLLSGQLGAPTWRQLSRKAPAKRLCELKVAAKAKQAKRVRVDRSRN